MTTDEMKQIGFTENGIEKFLAVIESSLPHTPGNWGFMRANEKLQIISKYKFHIEKYLKKAKPVFTDAECEAIAWFSTTDANKIKRLNDIQSASQTLMSYF